ncbi:hypothetical protein GOBAR_AA17181 [Gossypium barbadense]|uniref:F-box/LRR-repeat protein 15/At3g58940/PEG3-like LRR domain-containing protein n=1 Tax=Gossypium barbadense TaxID=3634 RepID=A0A2P5XJH1_GOSBA|nr:hypothetical protein GOBAR_AA17181 [Gossypium barbadense]
MDLKSVLQTMLQLIALDYFWDTVSLTYLKWTMNIEAATGEDFSVEPTDTKRPFRAVLDVGLIRTATGNHVFGALKPFYESIDISLSSPPLNGRRQRSQLGLPDLLYTQVFKVCSEGRHKLVKPNHKTKAENTPVPIAGRRTEAVRTSIISTKWRYLFASISTIKFDGHLMRGLTDRNVDSFKNFVDRLLKFPDQEIDLDLDNLGDILPALLFTCHSLVTLKLVAVGSEITVPSDVCLGNLKTLQLRNASFVGDSIHRLISNCHVLEDLAFIHCDSDYLREVNIQSPSLKRLVLDFDLGESGNLDYVVVINAPNLVYFQYTDAVVEGYTLTNMKSLEKARLNICENDSIDCETSATHLIQGIRSVRSLSLTTDEAIFRTSQLPIFHNLIEFEYGGHGFNGIETWLVEFLHCAPNLETLNLNFPASFGSTQAIEDEGQSVLNSFRRQLNCQILVKCKFG